MSITRVGSTKKFSEGWENIFSGKRSGGSGVSSQRAVTKVTGKKAVAKSAKKSSKKKPAKSVAPAPPGTLKKKAKKRPAMGSNQGPGDDASKKSAAKRTSKTRVTRPRPALEQQ